MKYNAPELNALTTAVDAIHSSTNKLPPTSGDSAFDVQYEGIGAYQDWE